MTYLLVFAAGVTIAAPIVSHATYRATVRRSDVVTYDHHRDWRALAEQADHDHRLAVRTEGALLAFRDLYRFAVGDLLDTVAQLRAELDQMRPPRHLRIPPYAPAMFPYGAALARQEPTT